MKFEIHAADEFQFRLLLLNICHVGIHTYREQIDVRARRWARFQSKYENINCINREHSTSHLVRTANTKTYHFDSLSPWIVCVEWRQIVRIHRLVIVIKMFGTLVAFVLITIIKNGIVCEHTVDGYSDHSVLLQIHHIQHMCDWMGLRTLWHSVNVPIINVRRHSTKFNSNENETEK